MTTASSSIVDGEVLGATCSESGTTTQLMEEHRSSLAATNEVINRNPSSRLQSSRFACLRCCGNLINYLIRLRNTPEELEQRYKSKEIDKFLEKEKQTFRRQACTYNLLYNKVLLSNHVLYIIGKTFAFGSG